MNADKIMEALESIKKGFDTLIDAFNEVDGDTNTAPTGKKKTTKKKTSKKKTTSKKVVDEDEDLLGDSVGGNDDDFNFDDEDDSSDESESEISVDDVREKLKEFAMKFKDKNKGRANARKILAKFGAKTVDDLEEDNYKEVLEIIEKNM